MELRSRLADAFWMGALLGLIVLCSLLWCGDVVAELPRLLVLLSEEARRAGLTEHGFFRT